MSLWYDIKKKSYASDAKGSWIKLYVDKMLAELKTKFNTHLEAHYIGDEGRHSADDVICNDGKSVEAALLKESAERLSTAAAIRQEVEIKNAELSETIGKEVSDRISSDETIYEKISVEENTRVSADNILQSNIDAEIKNRQAALDLKVDKVSGKALSSNDYTDAEKNKLSLIEERAERNLVISVSGKTGDVAITKEDVGLSNADNTSDLNKPISTATQAALDKKTDKAYVDNALSGKVDVSDVITKTNTTAFTPTDNYQPATKKYVDDNISAAGGGDMMKSVYDTNGDGVVDDAAKLGGQLPSYYATKAEVDAKAPKSHLSSSTTYGAGSTTAYGHVKLANNLTTTSTTGYALAANQGKVLDDKITALITSLNTPPALTSVTPDGTKIGEASWTGTGWVCMTENTKYVFNDEYFTLVNGFNRFCLKPADNSAEWKNWTPFFNYDGQFYEFFFSPTRGLYEALIPATTMTAEEVVAAIEWKNIPPTILNYGKISNMFGCYETITQNDDGTTTSDKTHFIRREGDWRDTTGRINNDDLNAQQGLSIGAYSAVEGDIDINSAALAMLSADVCMNTHISFDSMIMTNQIIIGKMRYFKVDSIDNFN